MIQQLCRGLQGVCRNFFLKKREYCAVKFELFLSLEITDTDRTHRNIVCAAEELHVFAHWATL